MRVREHVNIYLLEVLKLLVACQPLLLVHATMDGDGREILLNQKLGESCAPLHGLDKDDDLVKFQDVEQLKQLPVLLGVLELKVMLLQPVQRQLGLVVHINFHRLQRKQTSSQEKHIQTTNLWSKAHSLHQFLSDQLFAFFIQSPSSSVFSIVLLTTHYPLFTY